MRPLAALAVILLASAAATAAAADPCGAIPERGPAPSWLRVGATVTGTVPHVIDGDSLCIAAEPRYRDTPAAWIEIRLEDVDAPELWTDEGPDARQRLADLVAGQTVSCTIARARRPRDPAQPWRSYDRAIATCAIDGIPIADRLPGAGPAVRRWGRYTGRAASIGVALLVVAPLAGAMAISLLGRSRPRGRPR